MKESISRRYRPWLLFTALFFPACNSKLDKLGIDDTVTPIFSAAEISYPLVNQYVFSKSCNSCHGGAKTSGGVNLESYEGAALFGKQIKADVDTGRMPQSPAAPLSQRQKDIVSLWVAQGMPNIAGGAPAPQRPPLEPKFASIHDGIFKFKCATCHNPEGKAKHVRLDTPKDLLVGQNILVVPGKPEQSKLIRLVSAGARRPMPPKSTEAHPLPPDEIKEPLTPEELAQFTSWIQEGAIDDTDRPDSKFRAIRKNIIDEKCMICHDSGSKADSIPLATVEDLVGGGVPFVIPGDPDLSKLLSITKPDAANPMPPKNSNVEPVSEEEWNIMKEWVTNGANQ